MDSGSTSCRAWVGISDAIWLVWVNRSREAIIKSSLSNLLWWSKSLATSLATVCSKEVTRSSGSSMADRKESAEAGHSREEEGVWDRERAESESGAENWTMVRKSVRDQSSEGRILFLM